MNMGKALTEVLEFSNELDILHKHITNKNLPVKKSDVFDKQCFLLEEYLREDAYRSAHKQMNLLNTLSGIFALPVLLVIAAAFVYGKWINPSYDLFGFFVQNPVLYLVPLGFIIVTLILAVLHSMARKKLYYTIYPELKEKLEIGKQSATTN